MDFGTVAPKKDRIDDILKPLPPPKLPPLKHNFTFQMEVIQPSEPLWLSIWRHQAKKDLVEDLRLYEQQWRLLSVLWQIMLKKIGDENMGT